MIRIAAKIAGVPEPPLPTPGWAVRLAATGLDLIRALGIEAPAEGNQLRLSVRDLYFELGKAWATLGEPRISIEQSIAETYIWYKTHGYL
ncbi:MAG: hypothetical protein HC915_10800 [Anaerolineae bacterium]|nr:hypothetical protein [Anaerolineae bacterium]